MSERSADYRSQKEVIIVMMNRVDFARRIKDLTLLSDTCWKPSTTLNLGPFMLPIIPFVLFPLLTFDAIDEDVPTLDCHDLNDIALLVGK